jgi:AmiR/NasT family two-component response regulator
VIEHHYLSNSFRREAYKMPEENQQKKAKAVVISRQDLTEEEAHDYIEQHGTEQEEKDVLTLYTFGRTENG